jgi:methylglutaconyl-CoA hydratase
MSEQNLLLQQDARGVATLTLNRAERHNAFDDVLIDEFNRLLDHLASEESCRVLVLRATGKSFSAGADLNWMRRMADYDRLQNHDDAMQLARLMKSLNDFPHPSLALVQGSAFGGGVGLVACCDVALASTRASFCLSEVRLGLVPAVISPYVIRAIGERAARRYFVTAERFDTLQAQALGLVHEVVEADQLDEAGAQIINEILKGGPAAQSAAKKLIGEVAQRLLDEALLNHTAETIATIRASDEGREGLGAFLQKRPASWTED